MVQVGALSLKYYTKQSRLVLDLICKELGYKRHIVEFGIRDGLFSNMRTKYIQNGVLSNLICPGAAKSFSDCTFLVGQVNQQSCVAVACEPEPSELNCMLINV